MRAVSVLSDDRAAKVAVGLRMQGLKPTVRSMTLARAGGRQRR